MKRILVLGDSLSDGFELKRSQAYPALLVPKLRAAGLSYEITNLSQSGGTTEDGLRFLPKGLQSAVDIFILELGINDAIHGSSVERIGRNLQTIIDNVKSQNPEARIVILGMEVPNHSSHNYLGRFGKMYENLAVQNHAALLPFLLEGVTGHLKLTIDGLHPNAAGHKIMAENVWVVLEPVAREVSAVQ